MLKAYNFFLLFLFLLLNQTTFAANVNECRDLFFDFEHNLKTEADNQTLEQWWELEDSLIEYKLLRKDWGDLTSAVSSILKSKSISKAKLTKLQNFIEKLVTDTNTRVRTNMDFGITKTGLGPLSDTTRVMDALWGDLFFQNKSVVLDGLQSGAYRSTQFKADFKALIRSFYIRFSIIRIIYGYNKIRTNVHADLKIANFFDSELNWSDSNEVGQALVMLSAIFPQVYRSPEDRDILKLIREYMNHPSVNTRDRQRVRAFTVNYRANAIQF